MEILPADDSWIIFLHYFISTDLAIVHKRISTLEIVVLEKLLVDLCPKNTISYSSFIAFQVFCML